MFSGKEGSCSIPVANKDILGGRIVEDGDVDSGGDSMSIPNDFKTLSLSPNEDTVLAIRKEQMRLKDIAIFFVFLYKMPFLLKKILMIGFLMFAKES